MAPFGLFMEVAVAVVEAPGAPRGGVCPGGGADWPGGGVLLLAGGTLSEPCKLPTDLRFPNPRLLFKRELKLIRMGRVYSGGERKEEGNKGNGGGKRTRAGELRQGSKVVGRLAEAEAEAEAQRPHKGRTQGGGWEWEEGVKAQENNRVRL
jgi:hypothetical protein